MSGWLAPALLVVYSASFPYWDCPPDLWAARLVSLKAMGFNAVQIPGRNPERQQDRDAAEFVRLARQAGLRVWLEREAPDPALDPYRGSRGGPILDELGGRGEVWFPAGEHRLLAASDLILLRRLVRKQEILSGFDAGWVSGQDARLSDPSNYLLAARAAIAAGVKALNWSAVVEGRAAPERAPALGADGEPRPQAAALARTGALVRHFGRLLAGMTPRPPPAQSPPVPSSLHIALLASPAPRGPAFLSALNFSDKAPAVQSLAVIDPKTGRQILVGLNLPPRQALLMPINLPLASPEVCPTCSAFAPDERLVWAGAELVSVALENGVLAMEFVAPAEAEAVLELARQPRGPLLTAAHLRNLDWDEKNHRLRIRIPAGKPPDFRSRVGLGMELPDTSAFLQAPSRLILGATAVVKATFSSAELAARSRLLAPPGWRFQTEARTPAEIDYRIDVPADALPGDAVTLAVEADGRIAQSITVPLGPFCSVRIEPEEALQLRPNAAFRVRPHLATLVLPRRRQYRIHLRNHSDEIRTFEVAASGEGLRFSPSRVEVSIGANLEREAVLNASGVVPRPGLYRWKLEVREGGRRMELPLALAVISPDETLTYQYDLDRDGAPEWILENPKARAAFSPRLGGRMIELLLKEPKPAPMLAGASLDAGVALEARAAAPGVIEMNGPGLTRRISLGPGDSAVEVEQTGGAAEWSVSARPALALAAEGATVEMVRHAASTEHRLRFPDGAPRRVRLYSEALR